MHVNSVQKSSNEQNQMVRVSNQNENPNMIRFSNQGQNPYDAYNKPAMQNYNVR